MSEIGIKDQCFGVEVEMTGITREQAAHALADYFGTSPQYLGTGYDTWGATDPEGKVWKLMSDASIRAERKTRTGYTSNAGTSYRVEMVTPKLTYEELPKFQECIRISRPSTPSRIKQLWSATRKERTWACRSIARCSMKMICPTISSAAHFLWRV